MSKITFKAAGISEEMTVPSIAFGLNRGITIKASTVKPDNNAQVFDFTQYSMTPFSFIVSFHKEETRKALFTWFIEREVKKDATIKIDYQDNNQARIISFENVYLMSYNEEITNKDSHFDITIVARYFTNEGTRYDQAQLL
jgi:hypothetical protein